MSDFQTTQSHYGDGEVKRKTFPARVIADSGSNFYDVQIYENDGSVRSTRILNQIYAPDGAEYERGDMVMIYYSPPARPVIMGGAGSGEASASLQILPIWIA